jgi:RimJ/RimL family protein N-acetyltransferase
MFPILTRDDVFRIETRRLWLRWPRAEDACGMAHWVGRPEVATMTSTYKIDMSPDEVAERLNVARLDNAAGRAMAFVLTPKGSDSESIGMAGATVGTNGTIELGYHLDPKFWGRGLMTEAVRALSAQVFELTDACKVVASTRPDNHGSIKVLAKSGFKSTGGGEHESPIYGRYMVRHFALARSQPSALLNAQKRFGAGLVATAHDLVGLV